MTLLFVLIFFKDSLTKQKNNIADIKKLSRDNSKCKKSDLSPFARSNRNVQNAETTSTHQEIA